MAKEPLLGRLVVVGSNQERPVGTDLLGVFGQTDGLVGRVRPGAGNDRDTSRHGFNGEGHHALMLSMREGGGFAGCSTWDDPVCTIRDLKLDQVPQRFFVDLSVPEWSDDRD